MSQTATVPPIVNRAMKLVLRSPVHAMVSKTILLITFTGRKTGKTYTTPVSYSHCGDQMVIFTHAGWWKNLRNGAAVTLRLQGREFRAWAEPTAEDKTAVAAGLAAHLQQVRSDAAFYGVTFDERGLPRREAVERAATTVVMITLRAC